MKSSFRKFGEIGIISVSEGKVIIKEHFFFLKYLVCFAPAFGLERSEDIVEVM